MSPRRESRPVVGGSLSLSLARTLPIDTIDRATRGLMDLCPRFRALRAVGFKPSSQVLSVEETFSSEML